METVKGGVTQLGASDEHYTRQVPLILELQESPALSESLVLCQGELTYSMLQRNILCPICQLQSRDQNRQNPSPSSVIQHTGLFPDEPMWNSPIKSSQFYL